MSRRAWFVRRLGVAVGLWLMTASAAFATMVTAEFSGTFGDPSVPYTCGSAMNYVTPPYNYCGAAFTGYYTFDDSVSGYQTFSGYGYGLVLDVAGLGRFISNSVTVGVIDTVLCDYIFTVQHCGQTYVLRTPAVTWTEPDTQGPGIAFKYWQLDLAVSNLDGQYVGQRLNQLPDPTNEFLIGERGNLFNYGETGYTLPWTSDASNIYRQIVTSTVFDRGFTSWRFLDQARPVPEPGTLGLLGVGLLGLLGVRRVRRG